MNVGQKALNMFKRPHVLVPYFSQGSNEQVSCLRRTRPNFMIGDRSSADSGDVPFGTG